MLKEVGSSVVNVMASPFGKSNHSFYEYVINFLSPGKHLLDVPSDDVHHSRPKTKSVVIGQVKSVKARTDTAMRLSED